MSMHLTITLSRSQARWDSNTWALSLRSDFSPRITAPYVGVMFTMNTVECSEHCGYPINWPFSFPANTCAVTTKFVMSGEQPIVEILHWDDGGWQFMCNTTDNADDGVVVCMGCLYRKFPWISKFKDLALNHSAYLEKGNWQIEELE